MFSSHVAGRYLRNCKSFLAIYGGRHCCHGKTHSRGGHFAHKFKQKGNTGQIGSKKSVKSVKKHEEPKVYTRDIIRNISNMLRYSTWDSARQQLESLAIKWDSFTVSQVLKTHPPMEKAWLFFNWASQLKGFKHDQYAYTTMLDIFGEAGRISSMNFVFQQMQEKGIKVDAVTYTSLLHWLSNKGDVDCAMKVWNEMKDSGCCPTVVSYTAYMKVLFDHNRVKEGKEVYKEMLQSGCSPNCHTYTVLMEYLARFGKFNEVLEIFFKMQEAGVQPDKASCNILVQKCCKAGETRAMTKILQYMKENFLVLRHPVYLEALETLKKAGLSRLLLNEVNPHFSIQHTDETEVHGFSATNCDIISSIDSGLVSIFLNRTNMIAVDFLLIGMAGKNLILGSNLLAKIIEINTAYFRPNGALLAFEYGLKMGISIERSSYLDLIGLFIRSNAFDKVMEILQKMALNGVFLGTHLSSVLIYRLGIANTPVYASKVFNSLPDDHKNTATYTALVAAYFSCGDVKMGVGTVESMREKGVRVVLGTINVVLNGLERIDYKDCEVEFYRKEKKRIQAAAGGGWRQFVAVDEAICNLLFAGDLMW